MPNLDFETELDETEEEFEDEEELEQDAEEESDAADEEAEESEEAPSDKAKPLTKEEKRIRALQSANDKLTAELNKIKTVGGEQKKTEGVKRDPEIERWVRAAQETARERMYNSEPMLKEYGLPIDLLNGDTPEEMQASLKALTKMVNRVATRARNKALREHGFSPEPRSSGATRPSRDFGSMSSEDFTKLVEDVARG